MTCPVKLDKISAATKLTGEVKILIYKSMYLLLFNAVTDALKILAADPKQAELALKRAQQKCEEMYIEAEEQP